MILHPNTKSWAWRCGAGCSGPRSCGAGYGSERAAIAAARRHDASHPTRPQVPAGVTR